MTSAVSAQLPPFAELIQRLRHRLPARQREVIAHPDVRPAAVAVPLIDRPGGATVTLTVRSAELRAHSGQIALPGGVHDADDDSPETTAVRETREELGIPPEQIEVLGLLDDVITSTGFAITPVVAPSSTATKVVTTPTPPSQAMSKSSLARVDAPSLMVSVPLPLRPMN